MDDLIEVTQIDDRIRADDLNGSYIVVHARNGKVLESSALTDGELDELLWEISIFKEENQPTWIKILKDIGFLVLAIAQLVASVILLYFYPNSPEPGRVFELIITIIFSVGLYFWVESLLYFTAKLASLLKNEREAIDYYSHKNTMSALVANMCGAISLLFVFSAFIFR